jgi:outer membrane protein assembly factor BamB
MPWTSPVEHDGVIYIVDQHGAFAYRLPDRMEDTLRLSLLWQSAPPKDRYYATPVVHGGIIYAVTQRGVLSAIDAADGKSVYQQRLSLGGTYYPSIAMAGGRVYVSSDTGKTVIFEPGRQYRELAANSLEPFRSTPVFRDRNIYVRGLKHLYCIGAE